jgi:hypothetical protein
MAATPNPMFKEFWSIKDSMAAEAGYDLHRICEDTRRWAAEHPHSGPRVKNAAELRAWIERQERDVSYGGCDE